jgi:hypothetical protein
MGVYFLHFSVPLNADGKHYAKHYVGFVEDKRGALEARLKAHRSGKSDVAIIRAAVAAGAKLYLGQFYPFMDREDERAFKNVGHHDRYCEICKLLKDAGYPPRHAITEQEEVWQAINS